MEYLPCFICMLYVFYRNKSRYHICRYEGKIEGMYYTFAKLNNLYFIGYDSNLFIVSALLDKNTNFTLLNYKHIYEAPEKISEITDYDEVSSFRSYKSRNSLIKCTKKVPEDYIVRIYSYTFPNGIYFCPDTKTVASREEDLYYHSIILHKYWYDYIPVFGLYLLTFILIKVQEFNFY